MGADIIAKEKINANKKLFMGRCLYLRRFEKKTTSFRLLVKKF